MPHELLIGQIEHGPQMHGPVVLVLLAFAVLAGLVAVIRRAAARRRERRGRPRGSA